jgi:hypothetical protein
MQDNVDVPYELVEQAVELIDRMIREGHLHLQEVELADRLRACLIFNHAGDI